MDSVDKGMGVTDGSWREKRKRGRPRKYGLNSPIIHSVSPLPAESPPPGFSSKFFVFPIKNRTLVATGSVSAGASQSKALHSAVSENLASGTEHDFPVHCPEPKYKINMETVEITGRQAQMRMHRFASTFAGLSTSFETAKKKMKELGKQVPDLVQIEKWNNEKASWDEKKKELERKHNEAREAAFKAVGEKRDLEKKLEKAIKEAEDAKASAKRAIDEKHDLEVKLEKAAKHAESVEASTKKAINEAALKFVNEKRDLEEKFTRAVKQVEDAQASGTKAIYEAVASTINCYKICLDNFVASLGNDEGKSLEDHVTKLFKAMPHDDGAPANVAIDMAGHEGDGG
ncbi:hypothetical protein POM88_040062 [Heracleum sosnowskyi]|uniref:Uncharacterized protein n=1 Tax=Heracleum sosnowskyi TaxID=360622 RepID=A0AAD8M8D3_9APIA|nr:hypothetical protein POM88_040062 [Heracleum sosnowskyi]